MSLTSGSEGSEEFEEARDQIGLSERAERVRITNQPKLKTNVVSLDSSSDDEEEDVQVISRRRKKILVKETEDVLETFRLKGTAQVVCVGYESEDAEDGRQDGGIRKEQPVQGHDLQTVPNPDVIVWLKGVEQETFAVPGHDQGITSFPSASSSSSSVTADTVIPRSRRNNLSMATSSHHHAFSDRSGPSLAQVRRGITSPSFRTSEDEPLSLRNPQPEQRVPDEQISDFSPSPPNVSKEIVLQLIINTPDKELRICINELLVKSSEFCTMVYSKLARSIAPTAAVAEPLFDFEAPCSPLPSGHLVENSRQKVDHFSSRLRDPRWNSSSAKLLGTASDDESSCSEHLSGSGNDVARYQTPPSRQHRFVRPPPAPRKMQSQQDFAMRSRFGSRRLAVEDDSGETAAQRNRTSAEKGNPVLQQGLRDGLFHRAPQEQLFEKHQAAMSLFNPQNEPRPDNFEVGGNEHMKRSSLRQRSNVVEEAVYVEVAEEAERVASISNGSGVACTPDDDRAIACDACSSRFSTESSLRRHYLTRHRTRLFECEQRDTKFAFQRDLTAHQQANCNVSCEAQEQEAILAPPILLPSTTRNQSTRFYCRECPSSHCKSYNLDQHYRLTHGMKLYECPKCDDKFTHQRDQKKHIQAHDVLSDQSSKAWGPVPGPQIPAFAKQRLTCPSCSCVFQKKGDLDSHKRQRHGIGLYKCSGCGENFVKKKDHRIHCQAGCQVSPQSNQTPVTANRPRIDGLRPNQNIEASDMKRKRWTGNGRGQERTDDSGSDTSGDSFAYPSKKRKKVMSRTEKWKLQRQEGQ